MVGTTGSSRKAAGPPDVLCRTYDDAVWRSGQRMLEALAADEGLDLRAHGADGAASLRRLVSDLIEEYSRHTARADPLREAGDGRTGENPPVGWRPVS